MLCKHMVALPIPYRDKLVYITDSSLRCAKLRPYILVWAYHNLTIVDNVLTFLDRPVADAELATGQSTSKHPKNINLMGSGVHLPGEEEVVDFNITKQIQRLKVKQTVT